MTTGKSINTYILTKQQQLTDIFTVSISDPIYHNDIIRISNLISLWDNRAHYQLCAEQLIEGIVVQIEAMSVLNGSIQSRYPTIPWQNLKLLSEVSKLIKPYGNLSNSFFSVIIAELFPNFIDSLKHILDLEQQYIQINTHKKQALSDAVAKQNIVNKLHANYPQLITKQLLSKSIVEIQEELAVSIANGDDEDFGILLGSIKLEQLDRIRESYYLDHQAKFQGILRHTKDKLSHDYIDEWLDEQLAIYATEESQLNNQAKQITNASLSIDKIISLFKELIYLNTALNLLQSLQKNSLNFQQLLQVIVILGEAQKNTLLSDAALGIDNKDSFIELYNTLVSLRDKTEHPNAFQAEKLQALSDNSSHSFIVSQLQHAQTDLAHIKQCLEIRIAAIKNQLKQADAQTDLAVLDKLEVKKAIQPKATQPSQSQPKKSKLNKQQRRQLRIQEVLNGNDWQSSPIDTLQALNRHLLYAPHQFETDGSENRQKIAEAIVDKSVQQKGKSQRKRDVSELIAEIEQLDSYITQLGNRKVLLEKLEADHSLRIHLHKQVNAIFRHVKEATEHGKLLEQLHSHHKGEFSDNLADLTDRRNFLSHDLWKSDLIGDINIALRIITDMKAILIAAGSTDAYHPCQTIEFKGFISAIENGNLAKVQQLITTVDINAYDESLRTPLHHAVNKADYNITRFLLKQGANPHMQDKRRERPLHYAAFDGHKDIIELLIEYGAIADVKAHYQVKPVDMALRHDFHHIATLLKLESAENPVEKADILHRAIGNKGALKSLLSEFPYLANFYDTDGNLPLILALEKDDLTLARILLNYADPNLPDTYGNYGLHQAISYGWNVRNSELMQECIDFVKLLIEQGADVHMVNKQGENALHKAAATKNLVLIRLLLSLGIEVNQQDKRGETPLIHCSRGKLSHLRYATLKLLLESKANPNIRGQYGTALHDCVGFKDIESVELLLKYKASPFIKNNVGRTVFEMTSSEIMRSYLRDKHEFSSVRAAQKYSFWLNARAIRAKTDDKLLQELLIADLYFISKQPLLGLHIIEQAVKEYPNELELIAHYAMSLSSSNFHRGGLQIYLRYLYLKPQKQLEDYMTFAYLYEKLANYQMVIYVTDKMLTLHPSEEDKGHILYKKADAYLALNQASEALSVLDELNQVAPNMQDQYYLRIAAFEKLGDYQAIITTCDKMLAQFNLPALARSMLLLHKASVLEHNLQQEDSAKQIYEEATKADPNNAMALAEYGRYLSWTKYSNKITIQSLFKSAIELDPNDFSSREHYACYLININKFTQALSHLQTMLELEPDSIKAHFLMANTLSHLGRSDEAQKSYDQAIRLDEQLPNSELKAYIADCQKKGTRFVICEKMEYIKN